MKETDDPDGVLAVLQVGKRLVTESPELLKGSWKETRARKKVAFSVDGAVREALDQASPRDRGRALHAALYALLNAAVSKPEWAERAKLSHAPGHLLSRWNDHLDTTLDEAVELYDIAIKNQGSVNTAVSKAAGRK